jgi:hypothetical protein
VKALEAAMKAGSVDHTIKAEFHIFSPEVRFRGIVVI